MFTSQPALIAVLLSIALLASGALFASHHLNGTWVFAVTLSDGQGGEATIELEEQESGVLVGEYSGALGTEPVAGKVDGNQVEISLDSQAGKITYSGTYSEGKIVGDCTYGQLGQGKFEATKKG